jgi:riboflavin kinase/FMN adenylyltransferase
MRLLHYNAQQQTLEPSVITVGSFDGVHLGHQSLFMQMNNYAKMNNCKSVVITFNPHPQEVLQNKPDFFLINSFEQVLQLLEKHGIDMAYVIPFSEEFSKKTATQFFEEDIFSKFNVKAVFLGPNHHFGKQREGDVDTLQQICNKRDVEVVVAQEYKVGSVEVSSTLIRKYLKEKDWTNAEKLMGHRLKTVRE